MSIKGKSLKFVSALLIVFLLFSGSVSATAPIQDTVNDSIHAYIELLSTHIPEYADLVNNCVIVFETELFSPENQHLFNLYSLRYSNVNSSNNYAGYAIVRMSDTVVVESSLGEMPYSESIIDMAREDSTQLVYDYGTYSMSLSSQEYVNCAEIINREISECSYIETPDIDTLALNGSVQIFLQNSRNCIVCAVSHMIVYWNSIRSGFADNITSQTAFNGLMDEVDALYNGTYANDSTPSVITAYARSRSNSANGYIYNARASNTWNPDFSDVVNAISARNPVLLGFASGSVYSQTVGHMTMCVDAYTLNGTEYVQVVDGHNSNYVVRAWTDKNDYICTMTVSILQLQ